MGCPFGNEIEELKQRAENRDYWKNLYYENIRMNEDWCEQELKKVCDLLKIDTSLGSGTLHDRLQELYERYHELSQCNVKKENKMETDLVKLFKKKMADPNLSSDFTWDDFFDEAGVEPEARSNFVVAAILKQAYYPDSNIKYQKIL